MTVILVVGLMGFIGFDFLTPGQSSAEEKGVKAAPAAKAAPTAKAAPAAKKVVKKGEVKVDPQINLLAKNVAIDITGTGFKPNAEVRILLTDLDGMQTDIGYALNPETKTNSTGTFFTIWTADEFIKAKLLAPGAFVLTVTDAEFKPLAETNVFFKPAPKAPKKEEKKDDKKDAKKDDKKEEKKEKK
jgi:hypothetical protein